MTVSEKPSSPYVAPVLTVDAVIFSFIEHRLSVLLIERQHPPFVGTHALPGAYSAAGETTVRALARVIRTKAGIAYKQLDFVRQLYAADTIARDPRGHAVSIIYMGLGRDLLLRPSSTTELPKFFPVDELPELAFDHADIITNARAFLRTEVMHTNMLFALMPEKFSLAQLQAAYEVVLGRSLDKRNFRKKLAALNLVVPTQDYLKGGAHRPAQLYHFAHPTLTELTQAFV